MPSLTDFDPAVPLALWGGAECTFNRVGQNFRDQMVLSGHNDRPGDLALFAGLGIKALRYPLLWETFAHARDPEPLWQWHDARLSRLRDMGIRPIVGLLHHGSGPRTTDLLSADFAAGLARHAAKAATRYPWVRDWTPVNEPLTTARFSALYGHWYPHLRDEAAFWRALLNQIDGVCGAMAAIRTVITDARLIQTDDLGHTGSTPELAEQAMFDNERRWASWDLLAGQVTKGHALWQRLVSMGFEERLAAIAAAPCIPDIIGINHYLTSDRFLDHRIERHPQSSHGETPLGPLADIAAVRVSSTSPGLEGALRACWDRYRLPMALTEVHNGCTREEQMRWLQEAWTIAKHVRAEGVAIEAVTAWSLLGAYDWNSLLTRTDGHYESGIFDVRGSLPRETALAPMLRIMAAGGRPDHPILSTEGWWRSHRNRSASRPLLIAGATGTLGQAFAGACRLRGIAHVLTGRDRLDLHEPASMAQTLGELQPWAVINCAGWVRIDEAERDAEACMAANFSGNVALADACALRNIHYSCFSSDMVFDGLADRAYVESDAPAPLNVYGLSKTRADDGLCRSGRAALVIRTASFFSPYDSQNFAMHLVSALRKGERFSAVHDHITSPTYVPDLVRVTLDLIIDGEKGLWHLVNAGALSWADFAVLLGKAANLPIDLIDSVPAEAMEWTARRPNHAVMASERGMILPSLASAIERFALEIG